MKLFLVQILVLRGVDVIHFCTHSSINLLDNEIHFVHILVFIWGVDKKFSVDI